MTPISCAVTPADRQMFVRRACGGPDEDAMSGRFAITLSPASMRSVFGFVEKPDFPPRHNIAPTQPIPIIRAETRDGRTTRHFRLVRWGFLPSFVKDPKGFPLLFNARAEGLAEKASFKNALRRRRCLVPADAFYEWQRFGHGRAARAQPFVARRSDGETMGLAGLWETWMGPNGEEVDPACIVTTAANGVSAAIHPRLPVVVEATDFELWLDPDERAADAACALLRPAEGHVLCFAPIGDAVNRAGTDTPEIMTPIGPIIPAGPRRPSPGTQLDLI